jgi:uncharacterized protein (TIGR03435 family)
MMDSDAYGLNFGRKLLLTVAGTLAVTAPLIVGVLNAPMIRGQSAQQFEAVSVKIHKGTTPGNTTRREVGPAGITYLNITLGEFIDTAYGVKHYQVAGPDWVVNYGSSDRYDLVAKAADPLPPAQLWQMVVPVLEERFKLVVHRETKELPVYALAVAKGGPKFKEGDGGERNVRPDGTGALVYKNYGMQELADALSGILERPTLNRTGLEGRYDFRANLQSIPAGLSLGDQKRAAFENQGDSPDSPVFTNLQEQLGLKIESQKAPVPLIVVDHAEKVPTEN